MAGYRLESINKMKIVNLFKDINGLAQLVLVLITIVYLWQTLLYVSIAWIVTICLSVCLVIVEIKEKTNNEDHIQ